MTDHGAPAIEDLGAKWADELDHFRLHRPDPVPAGPPFYRAPGFLLSVIGTAAVMLVVAAALLVADPGAGEIPTGSPLSTRAPSATAAPATAAPAVGRPAPDPGPSPVATPRESAEPAADPALATEPEPGPQEAGPAPAAPAQASVPDDADGPRINVTRSPMSFTPGSPGR